MKRKTKLVTVCWSTTLEVELPDDVTIESLNNPQNPYYPIGYTLKCNGYEQISESDGEITDIQDVDSTDDD